MSFKNILRLERYAVVEFKDTAFYRVRAITNDFEDRDRTRLSSHEHK